MTKEDRIMMIEENRNLSNAMQKVFSEERQHTAKPMDDSIKSIIRWPFYSERVHQNF